MSPSNIRKEIRANRRALSEPQRQQANWAITENITSASFFKRSQRIAGYISNDGEPDLSTLMQQAWSRNKQWHLPIIGLPNINHLWFAPFNKNDTLTSNRYGIDEPSMALHKTTRPWGLDLILMPLVAFDANGNRLGMGKGYYDRTLKFLRHRQHWRKPRLVGIAYELQKVDKLITQAWDIPLDAIVTEETIYTIKKR